MKLSCVPQHTSEDTFEPLVAVGNGDGRRRIVQAEPVARQVNDCTISCGIADDEQAANNISATAVNQRATNDETLHNSEDMLGSHVATGTALKPAPAPAQVPTPTLLHPLGSRSLASSPVNESYESLLRYVRRQLPSMATPEAKMMFLQHKDALLERKAKALARKQVWGPRLGLMADAASSHAVRSSCPQCGDWVVPVTAAVAAGQRNGSARTASVSAFALPPPMIATKTTAVSCWTGRLAALHLSPRPITLPWRGRGSGGSHVEEGSKAPPHEKVAGATHHIVDGGGAGGAGNSSVTPSSADDAAAQQSVRSITRIVRMTTDQEYAAELSFELIFRPHPLNPLQPCMPTDAIDAAAESPTPDEFYDVIGQVPFVLTYLHGDNELAQDTSRIAYAIPTVAMPSTCDTSTVAGGCGGGGSTSGSGYRNSSPGWGGGVCGGIASRLHSGRVSSSPARGTSSGGGIVASTDEDDGDGQRSTYALGKNGGGDLLHRHSSSAPLEDVPTVSMILTDSHRRRSVADSGAGGSRGGTGTTVNTAGNADGFEGEEATPQARPQRRGAAVMRMNRRWRVVFPYVRFARAPEPQSVHVLFVSQAPTKFGEILGIEIPIVVMEPPRIKLRLQQRPLAPPRLRHRGGSSDGDGLDSRSSSSSSDDSGSGGCGRDSNKSRKPRGSKATFGKCRGVPGSSPLEEHTMHGDLRGSLRNLSFTSQTPSVFCEVPDDAFIDLSPDERSTELDLERNVSSVPLMTAHQRRSGEQLQQSAPPAQGDHQHRCGGGFSAAGNTTQAPLKTYTIATNDTGAHLCRALLDIEADDILLDVEFSIRALVAGHRPLSTYAKEFLPSELIRYVHVPPLSSSSTSSDDDDHTNEHDNHHEEREDDINEDGSEGNSGADDGRGSGHTRRRAGPHARHADPSMTSRRVGVISTRWVIPIVAPLIVPPVLPEPARRSPAASGGLSRGPSTTAISLLNAATTATSGGAEARLLRQQLQPHQQQGGGGSSSADVFAMATPPDASASSMPFTALGTSVSAPTPAPTPSRVHRLALQVDVRLASLPRQVFRETFPLQVAMPLATTTAMTGTSEAGAAITGTATGTGSLMGSRRPSWSSTPAQASEVPDPPFTLTTDGETSADTAHATAPPQPDGVATVATAEESTNRLQQQRQQQQSPPPLAVGSFLRPPAAPGGTSSPHSIRGGSVDSRNDGIATAAVSCMSSREDVILHGGAISGGSATGATATVAAGVASTAVALEGHRLLCAPHPQQPTLRAPGTPTSLQLRRSAGTSRSPSPFSSPAASSRSTRKVSLAHVCVSAFAICRSGAILTFYRNTNVGESELGFSPLNSMNQCAPVHLHGIEKFAALLAERHVCRASNRDHHRRHGKTGEKLRSSVVCKAQGPAADASPTAGAAVAAQSTPHTDAPGIDTSVDSPKVLRRHNRHHRHSTRNNHDGGKVRRRSSSSYGGAAEAAGGGAASSTTAVAADEEKRRRDWRLYEDAVGWRLERSIDANYVLLRERGTCQCFAFRMKGPRARHGGSGAHASSGGGGVSSSSSSGKRMNRLDLVAVACFEPELPPLLGFSSEATDGRPVTVHKPVKQQYLLSDNQVLTLTLTGELLLTESSTVEKCRSGEHSPRHADATGASGSAAGDVTSPHHSTSLRAGQTTALPLPGACCRFTGWMLENDDGLTLLLIATADTAAKADGNGSGASPHPQQETHFTGSSDGEAKAFRRVLVYCVEESKVLYEFPLGLPVGLCPSSSTVESLMASLSPLSPPRGLSVGCDSLTAAAAATMTPAPHQQQQQQQSAPVSLPPALNTAATASIKGFTIVSAHEKTAMAVAWTPYQADVLTCCPDWARFSLFFVTQSCAITSGLTNSGGGSRFSTSNSPRLSFAPGRPPLSPASSVLSPHRAERTRGANLCSPLAAGGLPRGKSTASSIAAVGSPAAEEDSALVTILCVCPGDRAPHALVGAAADAIAAEKRPQHSTPPGRHRSDSNTYAEDYLAFFLLSNGSIYALVAPSGDDLCDTSREALGGCTVRWIKGDLYVHVEEASSPSVVSPNRKGPVADFRQVGEHRGDGGDGARASIVTALPAFSGVESDTPLLSTELWRTLRVIRVGTVFNSSFHTQSAVENCAMRYCPVDRDFLDVRGMLYLYATHASTKELVKDAIIVE